jgi:hypothetical protein
MCPAVYVKWATGGRPFCDRVANLLRLAGIVDEDVDGRGLGGTQLNRELLAFEVNYQLAASKIRLLLIRVHRHQMTWPSVKPAVNPHSRLNRVESPVSKTLTIPRRIRIDGKLFNHPKK